MMFLDVLFLGVLTPVYSLATQGIPLQIEFTFPIARVVAASLAFSVAAASSGWAISRTGTAGLAASAENIEVRTNSIIIAALAEALAIYGIVIAILILGQGG